MSNEQIKVADQSDLSALADLYKAICDHQPLDQYDADWTWGEYPSVDGLRQMINDARVMVAYQDGQAIGAGVLTTGEDYPQVDWPTPASSDEIGVLHLFGVHPKYRGTGIASKLLQAILHQAQADGKRVVHLDVLDGNVPSEKLYVKNGFQVVQALTLHYDDIGDQAAKVLEYQL